MCLLDHPLKLAFLVKEEFDNGEEEKGESAVRWETEEAWKKINFFK